MYKFRCELSGHTSDVRCIVNYDEEVIITGSRDRTCRVWTSQNGIFEAGNVLCGHTDFIASLCILPSSEVYPDGLIITGSNDNTICGYTPKSTDVQFTLNIHTDTVCCVNPAITGACGLLSSSWDSTAILWDLMTKAPVFMIESPNKTPIWSVIQLESGTIITGSADKVLRSYSCKGDLQNSYYGHSDCVRCLFPISKTHFLSCGNDGHVLRWNSEDTTCDAAIDSVHHFLYSVSHLQGSELIAYCGERGGFYVNSSKGTDFIAVPCTSVWSVTILPDGDIAVACSDGLIRLYTCDPDRYADDYKMMEYQREVLKASTKEFMERQKDLICPYLNDLSGPEILETVGRVSNQICFVRSGFIAIMYSWSTDRWLELARRKGTYQYDITKKKMHNGAAYDYLFPINIDDNKPNLILPLSLGDNILEKITKFIAQNQLSTHYGETIYEHIATTIKDDFLKASMLESSLHETLYDGVNYLDSLNKFFPKKVYVTFEKGNIDQIIGKLKELAEKHSLELSEDKIKVLKDLTTIPTHQCTPEECDILLNLLSWPKELMLPVLDLLRISIRNSNFHKHVFSDPEITKTIKASLTKHLDIESSSPVNQLLALKVACNMFLYTAGRSAILNEFSNLIGALNALVFPPGFSPSLQVVAGSLLLNLTMSTETDPSKRVQCLNCVTGLIDKFTDKEAYFRAFITVGTLISYEGSFFIPEGLVKTLKGLMDNATLRGSSAYECLDQVLKCFQEDD